jgi:hypothetical protein
MSQTFEACKNESYTTEENKKVQLSKEKLEKCFKETYFYESPKDLIFEKKFETKVQVINGDCLTIAIQLKKSGLNPVVLNMMNPKVLQ